ncbi:hypothetical protein DBR32_12175 [Taibaiella sp. KBW10]|uniref:DUF1572 family protein n=1 Tax=Taibaiella sp. KBW10 TaxID=2153357 RepID=UPI000F5932E6|nr:DUF1572 family protein [Taibaiella sp. KBW10]RQO30321.1 hypothetical protein DBR32_12175 [Taibaiella sp. KBW10]
METSFLKNSIILFGYYKNLGEKTFRQIDADKLFWQANEESNSIAHIVKHLWGNMRSRWTDFLQTDGEKEWRDRDSEFDLKTQDAAQVFQQWEEGWKVLLDTLDTLTEADMDKVVYIRNQAHSVMEAIQRQIGHYAYHVGQIVFLGKMLSTQWESLSIPRNKSQEFNQHHNKAENRGDHFTDYLK